MVTPIQVQDASPSGAAVGYGPFDYSLTTRRTWKQGLGSDRTLLNTTWI